MKRLAEQDPQAAAALGGRAVETPDLDPAWRWVWRAWHRLDGERPWRAGGMGPPLPGRIPWTAVARWAEVHRLSEDDAEMLDGLLGEMDAEFLAWHREQRATA